MSIPYAWADHRLFAGAEGQLLFGVEDVSLFHLGREAAEVLARWRAVEPLLLDQTPGPDREVLEEFRRARVLVPVGHGRRRPAPVPSAREPLTTLVLEVAQDCNLACRYCYADGGAYRGSPRLLRPELARRAARCLVEASGPHSEVTLVLFGGEPLMNVPAVRAAVEEAEQAGRAAGKTVRFSLTTNGTLVTDEAAEFLGAHRVSVSVSLDGPPDVHDANRPTRAGAGSYAAARRGLARLLRRPRAPVAARVTLPPSQWGRVGEVFDHLIGLGVHEVGIAPASPVTRAFLPTEEQEDLLLQEFGALADRFLGALDRGQVLPFSNLLDLLARIHVGASRSAPCGAGLGYLALDTEGRFYLCHRLVGEEPFRVGDLGSGPRPARVRECLEAMAAPREEACSRCWARALCRGGCHYENHVREAVLGLPPGGTCRFVRRWIELGIRVYARLISSGREDLLGRIAIRARC
ncbi:radical SAM protein [Deferrisoma sp.]